MKKIVLLVLFCTGTISAFCQYNENAISKKARSYYDAAMDKAMNGENEPALEFINAALKIEPRFMEALLSKAGIYGDLKKYAEAVQFYEEARNIDSSYFKEFNLPYSINLAGIGHFEEALKAINLFLSIPTLNERSLRSGNYRRNCYTFALQYQNTHPNRNFSFSPVNLGDSINTNELEYFPSLTIDNKTMVFTRRVKNVNEDFFISRFENGKWSKAQPLEGSINTPDNEGAQNISQDGQWLVFTKCNDPRGWGSCDIYFSVKTSQGWSEPQNMGGIINTEFWESQPCFSPDKRDLYFTSRRSGGYGGSDLYVSHRTPKGWSEPENLGPKINTSGDESGPFIHADNQTLYFSSNGHAGYGGQDLYLTRKQANGRWGVPENLGYPINTIDDESCLFISSNGSTAYYSSDRSPSGNRLDIYSFELPEYIRPFPTTWISGKVTDKKTGNGLPSAVELIDLNTKLIVSKVQTDEEGNYLITLPTGKEYAFNVNRKGYLFFSEHYNISAGNTDTTLTVNIPLAPLELNETVVLKNIFFDIGQWNLKPASVTELDKVAELLKENTSLRIQINGHTDNSGIDKDNLLLSQNRAKAVVDYLTQKGIDTTRLQSRGFGSTKPVAPNNNEENRAKNRRTELQIIAR